jgi:hypothetical protein
MALTTTPDGREGGAMGLGARRDVARATAAICAIAIARRADVNEAIKDGNPR